MLSVDGVHAKSIWLLDAAFAESAAGAIGDSVSVVSAARKATICMIQGMAGATLAVALYAPGADTTRSCSRLELGSVIPRCVKPRPAPVTTVWTMLAATSSPFAAVVPAVPLSLSSLKPSPAATASIGCAVSMPAYSAIRTSAQAAGVVNVTVTVFKLDTDPVMPDA